MRADRVRELALVAAATFIGSTVFTWPLVADATGSLPGPGDALYNTWVLGWVANRTAHGFAGLWNAPVFFPYSGSLVFAEPLLAIGVPLAPVYWLTSNAIVLHNVAVWASFVIAGTGGYVLGRDLTGRRAAGVVAGVIAAFLPYRLSHLPHIQVLMAAWLWWATWSVHKYFQAPSLGGAARVAAFYIALGLSSLYWAYIGLLPLVVVAGVEAWRRRPVSGKWIVHGLAAAAICAACFLPVAAPLWSLTEPGSPLSGTVDARSYSADLAGYVSTRPGSIVWGSWLRHGTGETDLFPGLTALICVLLLLTPRKRSAGEPVTARAADPWLWVYGGLALVGITLSLGQAPAYDGRVLFQNPLFGWLGQYVPGFAQLRTSARFVVVAQLALSVLAAKGLAVWLTARQARRITAGVTAAVLAALIFLEGLAVPVDVKAFSPYQASGDRGTYYWLARHPGDAMIELPLDGWGHTHYTIVYQLRTLLHLHPIVNGLSRYSPPLSDMLADPESPLVAPDRIGEGVAFLRGLGVRYVVLHRTWYARRAVGEAIRDALVSASGRPAEDFGDNSIIDLGPVASPRALPLHDLPASAMRISATRGNVQHMVDGDPATRWLNERPQSGADQIDIALVAPAAVSGVRLQLMGRSLHDYPRGLEVAVSKDGERFVTVFAGSVVPALGTALRLDPVAPSITISWPPTPAAFVRLHQTGGTSRWYWSVHELRLLTPD